MYGSERRLPAGIAERSEAKPPTPTPVGPLNHGAARVGIAAAEPGDR